MPRKKKSKSKERPMPDIEARKKITESAKSKGESKAVKCDKCNHVMNFKNELTVDKKMVLRLVVSHVCFLLKKQTKILIFRKNQEAIWLLKLTNI